MSDLEAFRRELQEEVKKKKALIAYNKQQEKIQSLGNICKKKEFLAETAEFCLSNNEVVPGTDVLEEHWKGQIHEHKVFNNVLAYEALHLEELRKIAGIPIVVEPEAVLKVETKIKPISHVVKAYINPVETYLPIETTKIMYFEKFFKQNPNIWTLSSQNTVIDEMLSKNTMINEMLVVPEGYEILFSNVINSYYFPTKWLRKWLPLSKRFLKREISYIDFKNWFYDVVTEPNLKLG